MAKPTWAMALPIHFLSPTMARCTPLSKADFVGNLAGLQSAINAATAGGTALGENKVVVASFDGDGTTLILSAYEAGTDGATNTLTAVNYTNDADGTATSAVATDTTVTDVGLSSIAFVGLEKLSADSSVSAALTTAQLANINTIETGSGALTVDLGWGGADS